MIWTSPRFLAVALTMTLTVALARAQGPPGRPGGPRGPGGPGGFNLVMAPTVQKELGLTEKQKSQLKKLEGSQAQRRREAFGKAREERPDPEKMRARMEKAQREQRDAVAKVLEPRQKSRLAEIELQRDGVFALARSEVAAKLKLNKDQSTQIEKILDEAREAERNAMPRPPDGFGRRRGGNGARNGGDGPPGAEGEGGFPGDGPPPGGGGFPGDGPPGEGGLAGGPPGEEGGFPGGGPPPGEDGFPGGGPPDEGGAPRGRRGGGGPPGFNPEEFRARFEKMRQERERIRSTATSQVNSVLTPDQQTAFKKMQGKPFDLASIQPAFGPGQGGPNRSARQGPNRNRPQTKSRPRRGGDQRPDPDAEPQF
ncbi:MAG: hypothetical protein U0790_18770 [Isosphaeraceae bacterium]